MPRAELDLLQGTLDVLVLKALSWGPRHGHAVATWIRSTTEDDLNIEDGALYTALPPPRNAGATRPRGRAPRCAASPPGKRPGCGGGGGAPRNQTPRPVYSAPPFSQAVE